MFEEADGSKPRHRRIVFGLGVGDRFGRRVALVVQQTLHPLFHRASECFGGRPYSFGRLHWDWLAGGDVAARAPRMAERAVGQDWGPGGQAARVPAAWRRRGEWSFNGNDISGAPTVASCFGAGEKRRAPARGSRQPRDESRSAPSRAVLRYSRPCQISSQGPSVSST